MSDGASTNRGATSARDLQGRVLHGRYRVDELLGEGGMGSVHRGWQLTLEKKVAIKLLKPDYADRADAVKRFLREARAASKIGHRNVVEVLDFGQTDDGLVYFVMEFLEGEDLSRVIRRDAPLQWPRARRILLQIVRALKAAHAKGIVHRDVKPANCFLVRNPDDEPDYVKVLDFGIAKVVAADEGTSEGLTSTSQVMGTALYMAPEQAMGRTIDARTDVYALGVMAFEMITGRQPFTGATTFEVLMRRVNEPPPLLGAIRPELGAAVEELLQRAMARDPVGRYQTMKEFEAALAAIPDDIEAEQATTGEEQLPALVSAEGSADDQATATSARRKAREATMLYRDSKDRSVPPPQPVEPAVEAVLDASPPPPPPARGWIAGVALVGLVGVAVAAWWAWPGENAGQDEPIAAAAEREPKTAGPNAQAGGVDPMRDADATAEAEPPKTETKSKTRTAPDTKADLDPEDGAEGAEEEAVVPPTQEVTTPSDKKADKKTHSRAPRYATLSGLKRKVKKTCKTGKPGGWVAVRFAIDPTGVVGMTADAGSDDQQVRVQCVIRVVERAIFEPGELRNQALKVNF